jgi:hypothetical protein
MFAQLTSKSNRFSDSLVNRALNTTTTTLFAQEGWCSKYEKYKNQEKYTQL